MKEELLMVTIMLRLTILKFKNLIILSTEGIILVLYFSMSLLGIYYYIFKGAVGTLSPVKYHNSDKFSRVMCLAYHCAPL
jgi:hypothetical protein